MIIVDTGTSYKYGAFLYDKADHTTIAAFEIFRKTSETLAGRKICRLRTDGAYDSLMWKDLISAPYSSAQNGLAERAIRTTIKDVRTLLQDSGLSHSYWAEAAVYSIDVRNLITSRRHPNRIPLESFMGKRQNVAHLRVLVPSVGRRSPPCTEHRLPGDKSWTLEVLSVTSLSMRRDQVITRSKTL